MVVEMEDSNVICMFWLVYCSDEGCAKCDGCPAGEEAVSLASTNCTLCDKG